MSAGSTAITFMTHKSEGQGRFLSDATNLDRACFLFMAGSSVLSMVLKLHVVLHTQFIHFLIRVKYLNSTFLDDTDIVFMPMK